MGSLTNDFNVLVIMKEHVPFGVYDKENVAGLLFIVYQGIDLGGVY